MPVELQERVHEEVELTKRRSGWPAGKTLAALGVSERVNLFETPACRN